MSKKDEQFLVGFDFWKAKLMNTVGYNELEQGQHEVFLQGAQQCYAMMMDWHSQQMEHQKSRAEQASEGWAECQQELRTMADIIMKHRSPE